MLDAKISDKRELLVHLQKLQWVISTIPAKGPKPSSHDYIVLITFLVDCEYDLESVIHLYMVLLTCVLEHMLVFANYKTCLFLSQWQVWILPALVCILFSKSGNFYWFSNSRRNFNGNTSIVLFLLIFQENSLKFRQFFEETTKNLL